MGSGFLNLQISVGREKGPENFQFSELEAAIFATGLCPKHPFYVRKAQRFYFRLQKLM